MGEFLFEDCDLLQYKVGCCNPRHDCISSYAHMQFYWYSLSLCHYFVMEKVQDAWVHTVHIRTYVRIYKYVRKYVHALHMRTVNMYTYMCTYIHYMNRIHTYVQCICMHICTYATTCIMHTACVGDFLQRFHVRTSQNTVNHMERE